MNEEPKTPSRLPSELLGLVEQPVGGGAGAAELTPGAEWANEAPSREGMEPWSTKALGAYRGALGQGSVCARMDASYRARSCRE